MDWGQDRLKEIKSPEELILLVMCLYARIAKHLRSAREKW